MRLTRSCRVGGLHFKRLQGHLVTLEISEIATLFNWDRPLSEQPKPVECAIEQLLAALGPERLATRVSGIWIDRAAPLVRGRTTM